MKLKKLIEELLSYAIRTNGELSSSMTMLELNYFKLLDKAYPKCRFELPKEFVGISINERTQFLIKEIRKEEEKLKNKLCKKCNKKYKDRVQQIIPPIKCKKDKK